MEQLNELYAKLTGVNIEQQKQLWDARGKGYYGEFLVFCKLYQKIEGDCKVLMNLELPTCDGKTTEIDLLMIHETGLYVFEVKHFKGTIYGKTSDKTWTQYFRTAPNQSFDNPILQNEYHVGALKRKYPNLPVYSFVVFTHPDCDLRTTGDTVDVNLCVLYDLVHVFGRMAQNRQTVLCLSDIDKIFCELQPFSPFTHESIHVDSQETPFYEYIDTLKHEFQKTLLKHENKVRTIKSTAVVCCVFCFIFSVCTLFFYKSKCNNEILFAQQQIDAFAQKFKYVDAFDNGEIAISKDMVIVNDVLLKDSVELTNTVCFSCMLTWNGENYCVSIGENAKIIVMLKNGHIQEYDLWNEQYPFSYTHLLGASDFYKTSRIGLHEFTGVSVSEINYIKLVNLGIRYRSTSSMKDIATGYEIELYNSAKKK